MALDGITVAALANEIRTKCLGGRISRIAEPEAHEILLTIKSGAQYRLLLSADPSLPLVYLTSAGKPSPMTAPERKATCSPRFSPSLAACAVRLEAAVAVRMPM